LWHRLQPVWAFARAQKRFEQDCGFIFPGPVRLKDNQGMSRIYSLIERSKNFKQQVDSHEFVA